MNLRHSLEMNTIGIWSVLASIADPASVKSPHCTKSTSKSTFSCLTSYGIWAVSDPFARFRMLQLPTKSPAEANPRPHSTATQPQSLIKRWTGGPVGFALHPSEHAYCLNAHASGQHDSWLDSPGNLGEHHGKSLCYQSVFSSENKQDLVLTRSYCNPDSNQPNWSWSNG